MQEDGLLEGSGEECIQLKSPFISVKKNKICVPQPDPSLLGVHTHLACSLCQLRGELKRGNLLEVDKPKTQQHEVALCSLA